VEPHLTPLPFDSSHAPLETVERGYSQLVDRLKALGAQVAKVE